MFVGAVGIVGLVACSDPTSDLPRPGSCQPFQLTAVSPAPDTTGVPPDVVPALTFNDFPDPDTIGLDSFVLYSGLFYHTGRYWVSLVDRRAFFRPTGRLTMGLGYTLGIRKGIRSLRECDLEIANPLPGTPGMPVAAYRFQVVAPGTNHLPEPLPASPTTYEQVTAIFAAHCSGGLCHAANPTDASHDGGLDSTCLARAGGALSLCARDARKAIVGVPSRQVNRLVLVAPRNSSGSYLLRKLVGAPPVLGHVGVPDDTVSRDDQRAIQDWIDNGALPAAAQTSDGGI